MKNLLRNIVVMLFCALVCANSVSAQVKTKTTSTKPHVEKYTSYVVWNYKDAPIWIGPHSNTKEKSGLIGWTEIKPGAYVTLEVFADYVYGTPKFKSGVLDTVNYKKTVKAKLAFRLTNDPGNPAVGQNYMEVFSKVKTTMYIADTKPLAETYISDRNKGFGVGFKANEMEDNTTACYLVNESSVSVTFTDPGHPFYGKTLMSKDSLSLSKTQRRILATTGFRVSKMMIIRDEGKDPIVITRTLPVYEGSDRAVLTDEFFDLVKRDETGSSKVYPMKIRTSSVVDLTIIGAYDSKGTKTPYVIPAGSKGAKGKVIYLKYGENEINLKYDYKGELPQTLIIRANERGVKWLKFQTEGKLKGKWILTAE